MPSRPAVASLRLRAFPFIFPTRRNSMRRHRWIATVLTIATLASGYAIFRHAAAEEPLPPSTGLRFQPGLEYRYELTWRGEQHGALGTDPAPRLLGDVDIAATLVLHGLSDDGKQALVEARLLPGARHRMAVLGQEIYATDQAFDEVFVGRQAYMRVDHEGRVLDLRFAAADSSTYKQTMQWLLTQTQVIVPAVPVPEWRAEELGPFGKSETLYRRGDDKPDEMERTRVRYTELVLPSGLGTLAPDQVASAGSTRARLDARGSLVELAIDEQLRSAQEPKDDVASLSFHLMLKGVQRAAAREQDVTQLEVRRPGELVVTEEMRQQLYAAAAAGLTAEQLVADVLRFDGNPPDDKRWMWRAVGLLELHPELASSLIEPFGTARIGGRRLILDLLASAATPEAQAAMRTILADSGLRKDAHFPELVQRLALVETPEPANARFLQESYESERGSDAHGAYASAVALGSTVGYLNGSSDAGYVAEAKRYNQVLRDELGRADGNEQARAALVMALGNARLEDNAELLAGKTHDESSSVRAAAATALRSYGDRGSFEALVATLSDADSEVADAGARALAERELAPGEIEAIVTAILGGGTAQGVDALVVGLLGSHVDSGPRVAEALRFIFARNRNDPKLQAIILRVLG
jgi:hypothetical protein